ncbi:serine hydrolase [Fulvivirgaceae bacterium BMA12]|uniref:Serine hydrolase n=1 Tax=Agaribacillus aureus TaxID=3051825 RepID=A0ABT8LJZ3_9BACT|nr:serine hydrolase [Fulvivirgaceae bacterium BMA12]
MKKYTTIVTAVILYSAIIVFGCDEEEMLPEIAEDTFWEVATPSSQQMDEAVLDNLASRIENFDNVYAFLLIRNGKIIHEQYHNGARRNTLLHTRSVTKRVTSALLGVAIEKSFIGQTNTLLSDHFPEILTPDINPAWRDIQLYHLVNMISGMDWVEQRDLKAFEDNFHNPLPFIFGRNILHEPATYFSYNSPGSHLLSYVIERSTQQSLDKFAEENLFGPLRVNGFKWQADGNDVENGGAGLELTARDMAKIGLLYLQNGRWNNQQVVAEQWVRASLDLPVDLDTLQGSYMPGATQEISQPGISFGNMWWTDDFQGELIHYGDGYGGQVLLIIPKFEIIVAMNRIHRVGAEENRQAFDEFFGEILPAVFESIIK